MPPLKGIDRGFNGDALKAFEEAGHGDRLAIVDASYGIPRGAPIVNFAGESSADALRGALDLVPIDRSNLGEAALLLLMEPDHPDQPRTARDLFVAKLIGSDEHPLDIVDVTRYGTQNPEDPIHTRDGFYETVNYTDTLFVRTGDHLPYACATFIIGHMQVMPPERTLTGVLDTA